MTGWTAEHGIPLLRTGVGIVFLWLGVLKLLPGTSPAEELAARTVHVLTSGRLEAGMSIPVLAGWECLIGLGMITGRFFGWALVLMFAHTCGTVLPLFFFPEETVALFAHAPAIAGRYVLQDVVLVSVAVALGATAGGGRLAASPARS